jgi:hypothetical protein
VVAGTRTTLTVVGDIFSETWRFSFGEGRHGRWSG